MHQTNPVLDFLLSRRSRPAAALTAPAPDAAALEVLLTAAARVPDHGALVPWRFLVLRMRRLSSQPCNAHSCQECPPNHWIAAILMTFWRAWQS